MNRHVFAIVIVIAGIAFERSVAKALQPPVFRASDAVSGSWPALVESTRSCVAGLGPAIIGDAKVTIRFGGRPVVSVFVSHGIPESVRTCVRRLAADFVRKLQITYFDEPIAEDWVTLRAGADFLPPAADFVRRWSTDARAARRTLPPFVTMDGAGCVVSDATPTLDAARARWLRTAGREAASMWSTRAAPLPLWPRALGGLDAIFLSRELPGELILASGQRPDGSRTICLVRPTPELRTRLADIVEKEGTCWVGALNDILVTPRVSLPAGPYTEIGTATSRACALGSGGRVTCCGHRHEAPPAGAFVHLSVSEDFACALDATGSPRCWGNGDLVRATPPAESLAQVATTFFGAGGLTSAGALVIWGPHATERRWPAGRFAQISIVDHGGIALLPDGSLSMWSGEITATRPGHYVSVDTEGFRYCGLDSSGALTCMSEKGDALPRQVPSKLAAFSLSTTMTCGVEGQPGQKGPVRCWHVWDGRVLPTPEGTFTRVSAARAVNAACGLRANGDVACWGDFFPSGPLATGRYQETSWPSWRGAGLLEYGRLP